ncbi:alcohol dehydrogenase catalytic domain-containing protein [Salicibibacter cibi]|uniref:Alcohol dehydrogenase catalytic domain-containing protein n=1 Tax=Salicibibacter cibi TaxID=2743001 RepID=A0A7T6ZBU3_9BACI|nr:alcohol dehydrogenase catalytic domain-containing protein [Salicibibacter cibi]QQK80425.1 alcohol dehydrogenase catalytic domain-containing protein [Salicibibacter cibi]
MKALYKKSKKAYNMSLEKGEDLLPGDDEVIVKVEAAGICGTDLKMYQGKYYKYNLPIILGHEFSGYITSIGKDVKKLSKGAKVTAQPEVSNCGQCNMCIIGKTNICRQKNRLGFEQNGAFADYVKLNQHQIHVLPDEVDILSGALIEPLAVVIHAFRKIKISPSDVIHVIGSGAIGLIAMLVGKANGAFVSISGLSRDQEKLSLASKLGADLVVEADNEGSSDVIMQHTQGNGADIVLECTGTAAGVNAGLELCKASGQYVQVGTWSESLNVDFMKIAYKEIQVMGSYSHTKIDWLDSIKLIQNKKIDVSPLIQDIYSLTDWRKAFQKAETGEKVKVVLKP